MKMINENFENIRNDLINFIEPNIFYCYQCGKCSAEYLQLSIMKAGVNTTAIHNLSEGEKVGLREPLGNLFPYKNWEGKNLLFIGGGIGLAPLRPLILQILNNKDKYEKLTLLYASRTPDDFCFKYDLEKWGESKDIDVILTIDNECSG